MRRFNKSTMTGVVGAMVMAAVACGSDGSEPPAGGQHSAVATSGADAGEVTVTRIEYPTVDDADTEQNWADLYLPANAQEPDTVPLVVLIHGGSWQSHLGADLFDPLARDLAARGMAVYNVEYRRVGSGGGWPTTFRDIASALDHVVDVDKRYPQLTTDDELVVGHSAGAQLAVWGGTRHKLENDEVGSRPEFRPTRVVSLAGPLDMRYAATHGDDRIVTVLGGTPGEVPDRYTSVDPIQNIDPDTPVIAMHGSADTVVAPVNSRRYVEAVEREDGTASLVLLSDIDHAAIVSSDAPSYERVLDVISATSEASLDELTEE
ncbi:prolyl oligopeptidase family serine peptidase [Gordonia sp. Z-3]|nr:MULTISPECIES: prolyl oligopeptidase family serine peptidase [unclassified Gordonia (in: high G+C Gram-positive bacteria)]MED5801170.1 prolyl oligopeptidase family serine peptidase [Gordonia sp. Z-3]